MSKRALLILLIVSITIPVFAQTATVQKVEGKVELMKPGGSWAAVAAGDTFPIGATISTGFRSSAILRVFDSEVTVLPLTRMAIEDLVETQTSVTTNLNLRTGKVRAQVQTTEGKTANFRLRSPVSTAAVRGTEFLFDGYRLDVIEGVVQFVNTFNEGLFVSAGNGSETTEGGEVTYPEDDQRSSIVVSADTSTAGGDDDVIEEEIVTVIETSGNLVIVVDPLAAE
jgi:hypothetical protein